MAQATKRLYLIGNDELYMDNRNPVHPVKKGTMTFCHKYVVGTDFTSGYGLDIEIDGAQKVLFCAVTSNVGAAVTYTESALSGTGRQGIKIATATSTTDLHVFIVVAV